MLLARHVMEGHAVGASSQCTRHCKSIITEAQAPSWGCEVPAIGGRETSLVRKDLGEDQCSLFIAHSFQVFP